MEILQVTPYFKPHIGGVESHVFELSRMLVTRGHKVTVLTTQLKNTEPEEVIAGIHVVREKPSATLFSTPVNRSFRKSVLRFEADLVHAHTPPPVSAYYASLACRKRGLPFILTYHCDPILSGALGRALLRIYNRTWGLTTLKNTNLLILTSKSYDATSRLTWRFDTVTIPNAVDTSLFTPDKDGSRFRERFNIAPDETLVLFVGRLVPHKGIRYLLQAASLIKNRKIKFLIAGEGPLLTALKKETARRGLPDRVKFSGRVAHEDLPFCYAACDIFVLPSTSRLEAFGIATLEAMSSGKPVIVSDIPGVRETIQNGDQGLLVNAFSPEDIAEKILYLHENPPERKRMGASARRTVEEKYSWQKVITQIETAYKEMMTRRAITKN